MNTKTTNLLGIVLTLVVAVVLLATAYLAGMGGALNSRDAAYDDGYNAALNQYGIDDESEAMAADAAPELRTIVGTVTEVHSDGLIVREDAAPGSDEPGETYNLALAAAGKVIALGPKDPAAFQKELDAYNRRARSNPGSSEAPPSPDTVTTLALPNLAIGDHIGVQTYSDDDADPVVAETITRLAQ